jgi:hypothetical protein
MTTVATDDVSDGVRMYAKKTLENAARLFLE